MEIKKKIFNFLNQKLIQNSASVPFNDLNVNFCDKLSKLILSDNKLRIYPDVYTFGFFCRKANILKIKSRYDSNESFNSRIGQGLAFHITPSNIPINFSFSFVISLLCGNTNIIRLPNGNFHQVKIIYNLIKKVLNYDEFDHLKKTNLFLNFDRDDELVENILEHTDLFIVWGSDTTLNYFRKKNRKSKCIDIFFGDRYSYSVINSSSFLKLNNSEKIKLFKNFYNDTYLVDQNACSSPSLIFWYGEKKNCAKAKEIFWKGFNDFIYDKYDISIVNFMKKVSLILKASINDLNKNEVEELSNKLHVQDISKINKIDHNIKGFCGYFINYSSNNLEDLKYLSSKKIQTITYFGMKPKILKDKFISFGSLGVDRIIPIGQSLNIGFMWDGYDLFYSMTRNIEIY